MRAAPWTDIARLLFGDKRQGRRVWESTAALAHGMQPAVNVDDDRTSTTRALAAPALYGLIPLFAQSLRTHGSSYFSLYAWGIIR